MMSNHIATEIKILSEIFRLFQCETCEFESFNIDEFEAHIKIHIPLHTSLPKSPLKKQDFGGICISIWIHIQTLSSKRASLSEYSNFLHFDCKK